MAKNNLYSTLKWKVFIIFIWSLLVFYPNPGKLADTILRVINPPVDPQVLSVELLDEVRDLDNGEIERFVLKYIPYQYDWQTFNLPWYYPSVEEVVVKRTGDCKSRMILLASIFEALNRDYELRYSINHFWVHYEGKKDSKIENDDVFLFSEEKGFQLPDFQWDVTNRSYNNFMKYMPFSKKVFFFVGFFVPYWIEIKTLSLTGQ